jgi:predicted lipoprotein with Yx(FWY)xxD motif
MKQIGLLVTVTAVAVAVLGLAFAGRLGTGPTSAYGAMAQTSSAARAQTHATVGVAHSKLGRYLVDSRGHSLYLFQGDARGKSMCNGECAADWPPLIVSGKPHAKAGVKASLLGTTRRKDGHLQATYNHHPLYTFVLDTRKGATNGEGINEFGAEWDLVSPAGAKLQKNAAANTNSGSPPGYGGSGW